MSLLVKAMQSKIFSFTLPYKNSTYLEDDQFLRNRKKCFYYIFIQLLKRFLSQPITHKSKNPHTSCKKMYF